MLDPKVALTLFFALALGVSFVCSLLEAGLLSLSRSHIELLIRGHHKSGEILKKLKAHIDRPLAAVLTLNTIANTVGAFGVGATAAKIWPAEEEKLIVGLVSGALVVLILVFSEVIPKTVGAVYCKPLAPVTAFLLSIMMKPWFLGWIVFILERISRALTPRRQRIHVSRDEVLALAELGKMEGALEHHENRVIQNLLALNQIRVNDILTPRSVMLAFQKDLTVRDAVEKYSPIRFSRIPIYGKNLDDVTGAVNRYRILTAYSEGQTDRTLESLAGDLHAVPDTKSVASTLDEFLRRREQVFLVVDEYGGTEGIITLEDVIETLLGVEIVDEHDAVKDMRKLAKQLGERRHRFYEWKQSETQD